MFRTRSTASVSSTTRSLQALISQALTTFGMSASCSKASSRDQHLVPLWFMLRDHAGVDVTTDNGEAAFKALADLKPNLVKTYTKSSDLDQPCSHPVRLQRQLSVTSVNLDDRSSKPDTCLCNTDGSYANFNTINVTKQLCEQGACLRVHQLPHQRRAPDKDR